jgi:hypothetical protein
MNKFNQDMRDKHNTNKHNTNKHNTNKHIFRILTKIEKELQEVKKKNEELTHKMSNHINFIDSVYERLRPALNFVSLRFSNEEVPMLDSKPCLESGENSKAGSLTCDKYTQNIVYTNYKIMTIIVFLLVGKFLFL